MKEKILQVIQKNDLISEGMHIIVGLSGGPDSVCLFDVLFRIAEENPQMGLHLYAVHVNHKFRPGEAEEDQRYVENLCKSRKVPCSVAVTDCKALAKELGITSEEAGRKARYDAFSQMALEISDNPQRPVPREKVAIALAHNANDQCETILFRIMRGTGTDGLAGMSYKRFDKNGFAVIRPILDIGRKDIEAYCKNRNLSPRIDHTNNENTYTRNKIRNLLIPYLEENFNGNITEAVNRLGKISSCDRDFLRRFSSEGYKAARADGNKYRQDFYTEKLISLHKAIRSRIYTMALESIGMEENVSFSHLEAIDSLLFSESPSALTEISAEYQVSREYEKLVFIKKNAEIQKSTGWTIRQMSMSEYASYKKEGRFHGAFSGIDKDSLCIRKRRDGDKIDIGTGYKKLQDFFVDEKLPKRYRDEVEILAAGNKVLWIMPSELYPRDVMKKKGRFSASNKVKEGAPEPIIVLEKL